jgi:hypothetical protein
MEPPRVPWLSVPRYATNKEANGRSALRDLPPRRELSREGAALSRARRATETEEMTNDTLAPPGKPAITASDKAYGWTIGCLFGFAAYLVFGSIARAPTHNVFASLLMGVAAGSIAGAAAYRWASQAKARWRQESSPSEE